MAYQTIIEQEMSNQTRRGSTLVIPPGATLVAVRVPMNQVDAANKALKAQGTILFSWDGGVSFQDTFPPGDVRRYQDGTDVLTAQSWQWKGGVPNPKNPGQYKTPASGISVPVDLNGVPANAVTGTLDTRGTGFSSGLDCDPNAT